MSRQPSRFGRPRRWLVVTLAIAVAVPAMMALQGCCSWCFKHSKPPCPYSRVKVFSFYTTAKGELCVLPQRIHARRGDCIVFLNTTTSPVTITTTVRYPIFEGGNTVTIDAEGMKSLTISGDAEIGGVTFDMKPLPLCPGLPGPGIDIDG